MEKERDILVYNNLPYFGEVRPVVEIDELGRKYYDGVRQLFDVSNDSGLKVEYWEPDVEIGIFRPAQRARIIEGEVDTTGEDVILGRTSLGAKPAQEYFNSKILDVHIMIFPKEPEEQRYVYSKDSIQVRIAGKGYHGEGYGGALSPEGEEQEVQAHGGIPGHFEEGQKINWIADHIQVTHDAFRFVTEALKNKRLKPRSK